MSELADFRKAKDEFFGKDHHSPLTRQQRRRFAGLVYYEENPDLRFVLTIEELPDQQKVTIEMATSTGDSQPHHRWGTLTFRVEGQFATLTLYRRVDGDELFLPFADTTNGEKSYGAGRYLDLVPLNDGRVLVDFNYAYSPYCAYNPHWSCPIPPAENRLGVPVRAGEKKFPDAVDH
jgi:uncharacterized protein (DUF1684 family)